MLDVGRLCIKIAGREAGKVCCIVKKIDENFVIITGPREITKVKRRRCSILHLEPLKEKISISPEAQDSEIAALYQKKGILSKLNIKRISVKKKLIKEVKKPEKEKKPEVKETKKEKIKEKKDENKEKPEKVKKVEEIKSKKEPEKSVAKKEEKEKKESK